MFIGLLMHKKLRWIEVKKMSQVPIITRSKNLNRTNDIWTLVQDRITQQKHYRLDECIYSWRTQINPQISDHQNIIKGRQVFLIYLYCNFSLNSCRVIMQFPLKPCAVPTGDCQGLQAYWTASLSHFSSSYLLDAEAYYKGVGRRGWL